MPNDTNGSSSDRQKSPVDQWFELFVYAPLGLALDARQLLPRCIDRGRSQVALARVVGRYAVRRGSRRATTYLGHSQTQVSAVLHALGIAGDEPAPEVDPADLDDFEGEVLAFEVPARPDEHRPDERVAEPRPADQGPLLEAVAVDPDVPPVDALAIPDYDNLSASQVVPRLGGLSPSELEAVGRYEAAKRGRKTILNKVAQLRSA
jgi:hypothetical protein